MDTEFTISSGTTDFIVTIDRDARKAKLIALETADSAECGGVTDWPAAEAPNWEAVHLAIEDRFGIWIENISRDWSATETANVAVLTVRFCKEQPTHRITFTDTIGVQHVDIVRLHAGGDAYTHDEWLDEKNASWGMYDGGYWLCEGQATPGGQNGTIEVEEL